MRRPVQVSFLTLVGVVLWGCHGAGRITETYVNQKDSSQVLELSTKETVKGMIGGHLVSPRGSFVLQSPQNVKSGDYYRVDSEQAPTGAEPHAFALKLDDNSEMKLWQLAGNTGLRDDNGTVWKLQNRRHDWRGGVGPDAEIAPVLKKIP
jgi:hypothetical protein